MPFNHIEDDAIFQHAINDLAPRRGIPMDLNDLNSLTFNCFDVDEDSIINELNDIDPDLCYYNQFSSNLQSDYHSENSVKRFLASQNSASFSVLHSNIRSFFTNVPDLLTMMSSIEFDFSVICLSETWLNSHNCDSATISKYNHEYRHRTQQVGGGVSIFLRDNLEYSVRDDLSLCNECIESVYVEIDRRCIGADHNVVIGCIYRPPKATIIEFNNLLKEQVSKLSSEQKIVYLTGDFNINLLNTESHPQTAEFIETLFSCSFFPTINRPTRITESSATLIDNIFVNNIHSNSIASGILTCAITDHCPVFCVTPFNCPKPSGDIFIKKRNFSDRNKLKFREMLSSIDWNSHNNNNDCQAAFSNFYTDYKACFNGAFPLKKSKVGYKNRKPWLTNALRDAIQKKNLLYRKFLKSKCPQDKVSYSNYKRTLRGILRRAERNHYDELFDRHKQNLRKSWELIREITNKNRSKAQSYALTIDGTETNDPKVICKAFNEYFANVGPSLAEKISPANIGNGLSRKTRLSTAQTRSRELFKSPFQSTDEDFGSLKTFEI